MATNKNITMKQFNGTDYDTLYPKTKIEQVEGAYTQQQILADSTKALYGLETSAVPDDAFNVLSRFQKGLGNEYVWEKSKTEISIVQGTEKEIRTTSSSETITYYDTASINNGKVELSGEHSTTASNYSSMVGKYFSFDGVDYILTAPYNSGGYIVFVGKLLSASSVTTTYGYVNSPDPNAYPPAVSDGYAYTALGQLGAKVRVETGSYTGTGTYGSSNPNSLTFDFAPKLLIVIGYFDKSGNYTATSSEDAPYNMVSADVLSTSYISGMGLGKYTSGKPYGKKSSDGRTIYWYHSSQVAGQYNENGYTYHYIAIG